MMEPDWLTIARADLGTREIPGAPTAPKIAGWLQTIARQLEATSGVAAVQGSYASGTSLVPFDMTAQLHRGEMVLDAKAASALGKYWPGARAGNTLDERQATQKQTALLERLVTVNERQLEKLATAGPQSRR